MQEQDNTWTDTWSEFWAEHRIGDLVRRSGDQELIKLERQLRDKVYPLLFNDEAMKNVQPTIIHGDLWSGNSGTDQSTGRPIIFDPSSSYSHNEAELGIMKMFGGYSTDFFDAYHQVIPKAQPHYEQRIDMYEAYHHLNHFVIFGGGYRAGTVRIFKKLIEWADEQSRSSAPDGATNGDEGGMKRKGLRGGAAAASIDNPIAGTSCQDSSKKRTRRSDSPPAPPTTRAGAANGHVTMSFSTDASVLKSSMATTTNCSTAIAPTPAQIADFFSQMVCYIWFGTTVTIGNGNVHSPSNTSTPARSPVLSYQPQHRSPLTPRRRQGASSATHSHSYRVNHVKAPSHGSSSSSGRPAGELSPVDAFELSRAMQTDLISSSVTSNSGSDLKSIASGSSEPSMQRLQPKGRFLRFIRELLSTTQLSTSVITLALVYVHRLKALHPHLQGRHGSEYRVGIAALMLANKILDDNTYLNKTWAEISGMPLIEISRMEVEFWLGLKMELHVSQESYESGLRDLHALSLERTRMIQEREAFLKRMSQQQAVARTVDHSMFAYGGGGALFGPRMRNSVPYANRHWNASSDALLYAQPFGTEHANVNTQLNSARHSVGYADHLVNGPFAHQVQPTHASHSPSVPLPCTATISPTQAMSYTLPSSPLSQSSCVPSLTNTASSTEAWAYPSDVEARTPQDGMGANVHDTFGTAKNHGNLSLRHHDKYGSLTPERLSTPAAWAYAGGYPSAQGHVRSSSYNTPGSAVTGLKRDFERANIGNGHAHEMQAFKRLAFDGTCDGDRQRHARLSSAGQFSPLDTQAWSCRPSGSSSPYAAYANDLMRVSMSPSHYGTLGMPQAVRPRSAQHTDEYAHANVAGSGAGMMHHQRLLGQPGCHSVFNSALTPTALAAPLEVSQTSWPMERVKAPLQYYSLAAGEAHGNVGTFSSYDQNQSQQVNHHQQVQQPSFGWPFADEHASSMKVSTYTPLSGRENDHQATFGVRSSEFASMKHAPAFHLDPQGWPLPVSSTPSYLFPYHLMPPQFAP